MSKSEPEKDQINSLVYDDLVGALVDLIMDSGIREIDVSELIDQGIVTKSKVLPEIEDIPASSFLN